MIDYFFGFEQEYGFVYHPLKLFKFVAVKDEKGIRCGRLQTDSFTLAYGRSHVPNPLVEINDLPEPSYFLFGKQEKDIFKDQIIADTTRAITYIPVF